MINIYEMLPKFMLLVCKSVINYHISFLDYNKNHCKILLTKIDFIFVDAICFVNIYKYFYL